MFLRDSCNLSSKRSGYFAKNSFLDLLEMIYEYRSKNDKNIVSNIHDKSTCN